jgi:hypothetical protein
VSEVKKGDASHSRNKLVQFMCEKKVGESRRGEDHGILSDTSLTS